MAPWSETYSVKAASKVGHLGVVGGLANQLAVDLVAQLNTLDAVRHDTLDGKQLLVRLQVAL